MVLILCCGMSTLWVCKIKDCFISILAVVFNIIKGRQPYIYFYYLFCKNFFFRWIFIYNFYQREGILTLFLNIFSPKCDILWQFCVCPSLVFTTIICGQWVHLKLDMPTPQPIYRSLKKNSSKKFFFSNKSNG